MSDTKTTVVNLHSGAKYDVFIGRPSKWGNPYSHLVKSSGKYKVATREEAIAAYREWILHGEGKHLLNCLDEIRGKVLGCTCLPFHCHGHVLAELADKGVREVRKINGFFGRYRFLSNFYPCEIMFNGLEFPTLEHAFQAAKTKDILWHFAISNCTTPGKAKEIGQQAPLREDWEEIKLEVMEDLLRQKFVGKLGQLLLNTGDSELIEYNNWGDKFWGVCDGVGENHLGKLLMKIREILRECEEECEELQF